MAGEEAPAQDAAVGLCQVRAEPGKKQPGPEEDGAVIEAASDEEDGSAKTIPQKVTSSAGAMWRVAFSAVGRVRRSRRAPDEVHGSLQQPLVDAEARDFYIGTPDTGGVGRCQTDMLKQINETYALYESRLSALERKNTLLMIGMAMLSIILAGLGVYALKSNDDASMGTSSLTNQLENVQQNYVSNDAFQRSIASLREQASGLSHKAEDLGLQVRTLQVDYVKRDDFHQGVAALRKDVAGLRDAQGAYATKESLWSHASENRAAIDKMQRQLDATSFSDAAALQNTYGEVHDRVLALQSQLEHDASTLKWLASAQQSLRSLKSTAADALDKAQASIAAMKGVCFIKHAGHDCPAASNEVTLWHWYKPDPYDPWCGGGIGTETSDEADGKCIMDTDGHWLNQMKGCCLHA